MDPTLFITPFGRLNRPTFCLATVGVLAVLIGGLGHAPGVWLVRGLWLAYLPLYWSLFCLIARRLQDSERTAAWAMIVVLPLVGPLVLVALLSRPGTVGPNRFGQDPYVAHLLRRKGAA